MILWVANEIWWGSLIQGKRMAAAGAKITTQIHFKGFGPIWMKFGGEVLFR